MFLFFCFFLEINVTGRTKQALQKNRNRKYYCLTKKEKSGNTSAKTSFTEVNTILKKLKKTKEKNECKYFKTTTAQV